MSQRCLGRIAAALIAMMVFAPLAGAGTKVTLNDDGVISVDGKKIFVISVSVPPPPGGKTPQGQDGFAALKQAGINFVRIRPTTGATDYSEAGIRSIKPWLDAAASQGIYCWVTLGKLPALKGDNTENERLLRLAIDLYKDHPALAVWKGYDEPAWVKMPAEPLVKSYKLFKQLDPNHPVVIIQAPMKASLPLAPYAQACDIEGVDIYPVTYPPGTHTDFDNKQISVVADCTKWIKAAAPGKAIWMTLQIAWGGTATPGKTLRFPTFFEQRYMTYAAIISGARGVNWQGGERPLSLTPRDLKLGWNWTYWQKVMVPLLTEINDKSPLHEALIAPDSALPIKITAANDIDFCVRETPGDLFILAAKREGGTVKVKFSGLPATESSGTVLYEEPRQVQIRNGEFEDWFGPNDVHVYRIKRPG